MTPPDQSGPGSRADEILQIFHKGAEFTQDLLKENERLRFLNLELEKRAGQGEGEGVSSEDLKPLQERIRQLEEEKREFEERIRTVEEENISFANRYVEIEAENNMLANLYIASFQLHATLDFSEVLRTISEIIIHLIGAEEFAIYLLNTKENHLGPALTEGVPVEDLPSISLNGNDPIAQSVRTGEVRVTEDVPGYERDLARPMVMIPLRLKNEPLGGIALYRLFVQKTAFTNVDHELFHLLGGHAATALSAARLHTLSERKLSTMKGFLELLTQ